MRLRFIWSPNWLHHKDIYIVINDWIIPTNTLLKNKKAIFSIIIKVKRHAELPIKEININKLISNVLIKEKEIKLLNTSKIY